MENAAERIDARFTTHSEFEEGDERYVVQSTPFEITVTFSVETGDSIEYLVEATVPSLDAVIVEESISDSLLEGWAEPFERRLRDVEQAWSSMSDVIVECDWDRDEFIASFRFSRVSDAPAPTDDIVALVGYLEGTYLQGIIPGYEYSEPVSGMLEQARDRAEESFE